MLSPNRSTFWPTFRRLDWLLLGATLLLLTIGLIILFAINFRDPTLAPNFNPARQVWHAVIGISLMVLFIKLDFKIWTRLGRYWYISAIVLLLLVMIFGQEAQGAVRALNLGILQFLPGEFTKLGVIMVLAAYLGSSTKAKQLGWPKLLVSMALALVPALLIALQPDLGSAIVVAFIWVVIVLISKINRLHLLLLVVAALLIAPLFYNQLQPYQRQRIETFLNPQTDPQGAGYNVTQAKIAIGSGQIFGRGLGAGSQSQLNFIPSQHTDFIFAVTAEKLGLFGAGMVVFLFVVILVRGLLLILRTSDRFGQVMALGIVAMFFIHMIVNIGMNLGLMPVTGIPLPFLSYGGTNLIINLIAIGILESIRLHQPDLDFAG